MPGNPAAADTPFPPKPEREFTYLCPADLKPGEMRGLKIGGRGLLLINHEGAYYALDDTCNHAGYSLHKGHLEGTVVTCFLHGAEFDVRTGRHVSDPPFCENQRTYAIEIRDGSVYVAL